MTEYGDGMTQGERELGRRVRELRVANGLSQAELANRMQAAGVALHASALTRIETGSRVLKASEAFVLADVLGQSVTDLREDRRGVRQVALAIEDVKRAYTNSLGSLRALERKLEALDVALDAKDLPHGAVANGRKVKSEQSLDALLKTLAWLRQNAIDGEAQMEGYFAEEQPIDE